MLSGCIISRNMAFIESLLPVSAFVAILLFVAREIADFFRRRNADGRRVKAMKLILARECELNAYTVASLRTIISEVDTQERPNPGTKVTVGKGGDGEPFAKVTRIQGGDWHAYGIGKAHRDVLSKVLLDVATLDRNLFDVVEPVHDGLATLQHLRDSLLNESAGKDQLGDSLFIEGLADYALKELEKIDVALLTLYKYCTGDAVMKYRIR